MRIDHLELTNFKNFSQLSVDFQQGVNLLVGGNGSGKTSLLEGINVAVGAFFASQEQKMQRFIKFDEIKTAKNNSEPFPYKELSATVAAKFTSIPEGWSRTIKRDTKTNDGKFLKPALEYGQQFFDAFDMPGDKTLAPLIAYYSTQRLFKDANLSGKQKYDTTAGRRNGYLQCLKENAIKPVLDEWLGKGVTLRATKQIKDITDKDLIVDNVESAIRTAIITCMGFAADFPLKIYQNPYFDNELFLQLDDEHDLPLSYYSDGFRNLIYLVIDMVWRASQLNPWLNLEQIKEQVSGVVTIDEIDLHLHPKWQAKAIGLIQGLFPNVQFFVTTHSPTVIDNFDLRKNNERLIDHIYIIDSNEVRPIVRSFYGIDVNSVLAYLMGSGVRPQKVLDEIKRFNEIVENEESTEVEYTIARGIAAQLQKILPATDAEIVRINSILERLNS